MGDSPLRVALYDNHFEVVQWLIRNGALTPPRDGGGGGIDNMVMRRDLGQNHYENQQDDRRLTVLLWAQDAVTLHDNVQLCLTGAILTIDNELPCILELIAHYIAGPPQQVRTLRQLIDLLPAFIDDKPFIEEEEEGKDDEEDLVLLPPQDRFFVYPVNTQKL